MSRPRVLLADDHRIVAEGVKGILEAAFELAGVVADGHALIESAKKLMPDVIVADISMPGLNGIEALAALKKGGSEIPVVFLTMHREASYALRALEAGAAGYVLKHAAPDELLQAVRAALDGGTFISPALAGLVLQSAKAGGAGSGDPAAQLTQRQLEILRLLAAGGTAKEIGRRLDISPRTVEFHKYQMMETLGVKTSAELVRLALQRGIAEP